MLTNLNVLFNRLKNPEYSYLLLEQLPLFGLLFGLIFFAIGLYLGQEKCRIAALIVIAVCACTAIFAGKVRQKAMGGILRERTSLVGEIRAQTALRTDTMWVYYAVAGVAGLALVSGGKLGTWLNMAVLIGVSLAIIFSLWLHMKESEVYHYNIKSSVRRA